MAKLIVVWGKNGAGKTTTAVNLSLALAKQNKLTGLISANIWYSELQSHFGEVIPEDKGLWQLLEEKTKSKDLFFPIKKEKNLFILSPPDNCQGLLGDFITQEMIENLIDQAHIDFDYLLVDGSTDLNNPISMVALKKADIVLNLARPQALTPIWYNAMNKLIKHLSLENKIITVVNGYDGTFDWEKVLPPQVSPSTVPLLPYLDKNVHYLNIGQPALITEKKYGLVMQKIITDLIANY